LELLVDVFYVRSKRPISEAFNFVDGKRDDERVPFKYE
jgi:hypothetical protein